MTVVYVVAAALVTVAALLALVRVGRGPSMLDRSLGLDLLASALVGAIAVEAAWNRRTETIPILVALALVGFVGSVVVARFAAREPEGEEQVHDAGRTDDPAPPVGSRAGEASGAATGDGLGDDERGTMPHNGPGTPKEAS